MRAKVARRLRKMAAFTAEKNGWPQRQLLGVNTHPKQYPWLIKGTTGADGKFVPSDLGVRKVMQVINADESARGNYLALKDAYKKAQKRGLLHG